MMSNSFHHLEPSCIFSIYRCSYRCRWVPNNTCYIWGWGVSSEYQEDYIEFVGLFHVCFIFICKYSIRKLFVMHNISTVCSTITIANPSYKQTYNKSSPEANKQNFKFRLQYPIVIQWKLIQYSSHMNTGIRLQRIPPLESRQQQISPWVSLVNKHNLAKITTVISLPHPGHGLIALDCCKNE